MRRSIFACGLLLALAGISSVVGTAAGGTVRHATAARTQGQARDAAYWNDKAQRAQAATVRWVTIVRGRPPHYAPTTTASTPEAAQKQAHLWEKRAAAAAKAAHHPPERKAWYCIHSYEGAWTDPNAPYWGGLQMDYSFQQAYAKWLLKHQGTADHWTPLAQIWAGVRAWRVRGFEPWSTTAHKCGVY